MAGHNGEVGARPTLPRNGDLSQPLAQKARTPALFEVPAFAEGGLGLLLLAASIGTQ